MRNNIHTLFFDFVIVRFSKPDSLCQTCISEIFFWNPGYKCHLIWLICHFLHPHVCMKYFILVCQTKVFFLFQKHIHTFSWCDASWNHHSLVTNWKINCLIKESLFFASWFCTNLKHQPCFSWFIYCARQRNEWLIMVIFHEIWRDHISLFLCSFLSRRLK